MSRLIVFAGLLLTGVSAAAEHQDAKEETVAKRSPASAVYGAHQQQYVVRQGEDAQEYLALLQQYLEAQQQQQQQPQPSQQISRARLGALIGQELVRLADDRHHHHQAYPLEVEQYHVETTQPLRSRPVQQQPQPQQQQQLYYPAEEQQQPAPVHQQQVSSDPPPPIHVHHPNHEVQLAEAQPALRYHQSVPIQYGYEDEQQVRQQQQSPQSIVRAQAQAEAQALAFQKVSQAAHYKHQQDALEQIRVANDKFKQQSALEQIRQGEGVSEAGIKERLPPKDPQSAYKAHLKAHATALVAEQRRAKEVSEYKAHADAILKLQATQRAHLKQQEDAHVYALNFEKNQQRAQAQAQAVANAQALALYNAHQAARAKAQAEAKQAARAQAEARRVDPDNAPVVQYLLPNNVPLPAPEVYLPKAEEALRAQAAHEKRLKKPHHQIKHLLIEEIEPQQQQQQVAFLVDAGYYRKQQQQQQYQRPQYEEVAVITPRPHHHQQQQYHQQYHQQIEGDKLALLVPVEPQEP